MKLKPEFYKSIIPHFIVVLVFIIATMAYFNPLLNGKKLYQGDIVNFKGMSKEIVDFRAENKSEPYWTNSMFSGMPSYQISTYYDYDLVKKIDGFLRFLPHPAAILFLGFISFYFMMVLLGNNWKQALFGAFAFGFSTYFIIILEAGHNAKAHAVAYFPMIIAGILLVFRKKYWLGTILTAIFMALEIAANHFQMTYYLGLSVLIFGIIKLIRAIKESDLKEYFTKVSLLIFAVILAFGANAGRLMSTYEYTKYSTRGQSELTIDKSHEIKTDGLDKEYITQWSYGVLETANLFVSRFMGGASSEELSENSNLAKSLEGRAHPSQIAQILKSAPTYWGEQPFTSGPAYIGAIIVFLFILGLFIVKGDLKWWLLASTILSIMLSWGKNFMPLTDLMLDYFPMYDKFRAVASIQVIAEFTVPFLAVLAIIEWTKDNLSQADKLKYLKYSLYGFGGLLMFFILVGPSFFDFYGMMDERYTQMGFPMDAIRQDRIDLMRFDSIRSLILILLVSVALYFYLKEKLNLKLLSASLLVLLLIDLVGVDRRYLNDNNFVSKRKVEKPFVASQVDKEILKDKGHYRVFNTTVNTMSDASTSYFHKSIGGYHGAKLKRYQELWDMQISKGNMQVINMLNTKYFIVSNNSEVGLQVNNEANGNAWFVSELKIVDNADEEMLALNHFNSKSTAVIDKRFSSELISQKFTVDSSATIDLISYKANELIYSSSNSNDAFLVFSEVYYPKGWSVYVDGEKTELLRVDYLLRAIQLKKGEHKIRMVFEPEVIEDSNIIVLSSNIILVLMILSALYFQFFRRKESL